MPVVHIPCFILNLKFGSDSIRSAIAELTNSELPSSNAVNKDLGNDDAIASYPSYLHH